MVTKAQRDPLITIPLSTFNRLMEALALAKRRPDHPTVRSTIEAAMLNAEIALREHYHPNHRTGKPK